MQCRQCGTEIAEKAIICYRCGAATTDPVRRPVPTRPRRSPLLSFVALAALLIIALYQGYAYQATPDAEPARVYAGLATLAVIAILLVRLVRRRR